MKLMLATFLLVVLPSFAVAIEPAATIPLWPGKPPGDENLQLPPEADGTKPEDKLIAGRKIIKLANVSTPMLTVYPAPRDKATGTAVIVCPGGGFNILAYDLEGTEVAGWLNSIGVTAFLLKYRVPFRDPDRRWSAAVQDAQRGMSLVRSRASEWGLDRSRIGILGFSAGGCTAALTATFGEDRQYQPVDEIDRVPSRPDFALPIYTGLLVDKKTGKLIDAVKVTKETPPMFLVQAFDDGVSVQNSLLLFQELQKAGVPSDCHIYDRGGHGYGLRKTDNPVTTWPARAEDWLRVRGLLSPTEAR